MAGRVESKVALVTGAARGQGRNHAVRLAQEGADVVAIDICADIASAPYPLGSAEELEETAVLVRAAGRRVSTHQVDVRDGGALRAAVDSAVETLGRLDIVVANAGIVSFGSLDTLDEQVWRDTIDVNLTGAWLTAQSCIPHLIEGGRGGSLVLISSIAGLGGLPNVGHYVAAKHGLVGLMRTLAIELGSHRIRVNTIHPTNVDTPMIQNDACRSLWMPDVERPTREQFADASLGMNLLPVPWVEPDDVSNALLFLVSDEGRYVTGAALPIDGGYSAKP